jgi:hypothetical protein
MSTPLEYRTLDFQRLSVRDKTNSTVTFSGYATTWDDPYAVSDFMGQYTERMVRGVFDRAMREGQRVVFLYDHAGMPLAATDAGNLRLESDRHGLKVTAELDTRQSVANDLAVALERGTVNKMSLAFRAVHDEWDEQYANRTVRDADLFDVSAVGTPANGNTSASLKRSTLRAERIVADARAGRVLSSGNETLLKQALDAIKDATEALGKVLDTNVTAPAEDEFEDENRPNASGKSLTPLDGAGSAVGNSGPRGKFVPDSVQRARDKILLARMTGGGNVAVGANEDISPAARAKLAGERAEHSFRHTAPKKARHGEDLLDHYRAARWQAGLRLGKVGRR